VYNTRIEAARVGNILSSQNRSLFIKVISEPINKSELKGIRRNLLEDCTLCKEECGQKNSIGLSIVKVFLLYISSMSFHSAYTSRLQQGILKWIIYKLKVGTRGRFSIIYSAAVLLVCFFNSEFIY
jgi:hypothetical protein